MSAISDLEEALSRCVDQEKTGHRMLSVIVDFLANDELWTLNEIGPTSKKRLIALAEKMRETPETKP